jgi:hypothetical protein
MENTVLKVFFVMTVSINRPNYLTKEQIAALSDTGNVIRSAYLGSSQSN